MNSKKSRELALEHGQHQIRIRALEDRLATSERQVAEYKGNLAVVCMAFKKYIATTSSTPNQKPLTDEQVVAKLNQLVKEATDEVNASFANKKSNVGGGKKE